MTITLWYNPNITIEYGSLKGGRLIPERKGVRPVVTNQTMTMLFQFGTFLVAHLTLTVTLIVIISKKEDKQEKK